MLQTLYLLKFNNYYNRQVKGVGYTITDYDNYIQYGPFTRINFNPADGIETQQDINTEDADYDYLVVADEQGNVVSRWFVIQATRSVGSAQYRLSLHRDLIVDFYPSISTSPCYVERAMLSISNPLIYNSENMSFNQIKKKELLLKDKTNTSWIVGYLANNYYEGLVQEGTNYNAYFTRDIARTANFSASYSQYRALANKGTLYTGALTSNQELQFVIACTNFQHGHLISDRSGFVEYVDNNANLVCEQYAKEVMAVARYAATTRESSKFYISIGTIGNYITNYQLNLDDAKQLNGALVKNTDDTGPSYFYLTLRNNGTETKEIIPPVNSTIYTQIQNHITKLVQNAPDQYTSAIDPSKFYWDNSAPNKFKVKVPVQSYTVILSEEPPLLKCRTTLASSVGGQNPEIITKIRLQDAPYTMFCMPYNNAQVKRDSGVQILYTAEGKVNQEMAAAIATDLGTSGGGFIYDLQLLPYCPIPQIYNTAGEIDLTNIDERAYAIITAEDSDGAYTPDNNCGIILFPKVSSFSGTITLAEPISVPETPIEFKIDNETKFCRLVSPNYAGAFDFVPTKNGGVSAFEYNCSYKPYQPYIHVNPVFNPGYLYGGDFNDNRGLVCGGDFSLPQISDAWENYQIQNKSYAESFARQIQNMDVNYDIEMRQMKASQWAQGLAGTLSAGSSGAIVGSTAGFGNPVAAAAGGISAGLGAAIGNIISAKADREAAEALHNEAKSYAQDQFNYSLRNVQALPASLSKVSTFDINNKLFPFVEFYEATPIEEQALRNKITYNSMSVMAIGKIEDYIQETTSFISAQLIRLEGLGENYRMSAAIAGELHKGIFI